MRTVLLTLGSIAIAIAAIVALLTVSGTRINDVGLGLLRVGPWAFMLAACCTLAQIGISALKWQLVLSRLLTDPTVVPSGRLSTLIACLAAVFAQFVPLIVAAPIVRGLAARYFVRTPIIQSTLASAIEQAFDVFALLLFLAPTIVVLTCSLAGLQVTFQLWAVVAMTSIAAAYFFIGTASMKSIGQLAAWLGFGSRLGGVLNATSNVDVSLRRQLLWLSILRYGTMFLRVVFVANAVGFGFPVAELAFGYSIVQASQIASATPGNLGLAEWTWVGVLAYHGHEAARVAAFSLILRVVSVANYVLVSGIVILYVALPVLYSKLLPRQ